MNNTVLFLLLMVPGTFFLGVNDILIRKVLRLGKVNEQFLLAANYLISAALLSLVLLITGRPSIQPGFWGALVATVILNTFAQWAWYTAFKKEEASLIAPLRLLTPPLVIVTGFLILGEKPSIMGAIGILTTILGLWILMRSESKLQSQSLRATLKRPGVLLGLYGALSFAISFPFDKKIVATSSPLFAVTLAFFAVGVISGLIWIAKNFRPQEAAAKTEFNKTAFIAIPLIQCVAALLTYGALNYSLAAYAASVKRLWSLWAVILSGRFLGEKNIKAKLLATFIMFVGVLITVFLG